ncbi:hypothetical protein TWF703_001993 [Orbilia oligospora]|uniref:F-box domain-containing protein n=1 Tax=Orbilia oligospora TaxID=2813651 RepID=A0A7C8JR99_ORBOL|nr:hypothetical protein TWF703_001993 [Orbilia oligospora]
MGDASSTPRLRTRMSTCVRFTLTGILRDPPPKRNDTPLNFTENIPNAVSVDGTGPYLRVSNNVQEQSRRLWIVQNRRDGSRTTSSIRTWLLKLRIGGNEGQTKSVTGPHGGFSSIPGQGSHAQGKERAHGSSAGNHRKALGHLIPSGFGTMLYGGGGSRNNGVVGTDITTVFPTEIIAQILSYLDHRSLLSCELVSRYWYSAALSSHVWRNTFEAEYGKLKTSRLYGRDWKSMFEVKRSLNRRWLKGQVNPTYLRGHSDSVYCVQFDQMGVLDVCFDESHIVSCSKDTSICVWERSTGLLLNRLRGHEGPVNAVQLRGNVVASASGDANIKIWDIENGNCMRTLSGHTRGLACIQLSEDRQTVVSGGNDQSIRVWDVDSGHLRYEIRDAHKSLVRSLYLDSQNERIISGSYDQSVRVWDLKEGKSLLNFPRWHGSWILAARADDRRIVSTSQDSQVLVLDFSSGIRGLENMFPVRSKIT